MVYISEHKWCLFITSEFMALKSNRILWQYLTTWTSIRYILIPFPKMSLLYELTPFINFSKSSILEGFLNSTFFLINIYIFFQTTMLAYTYPTQISLYYYAKITIKTNYKNVHVWGKSYIPYCHKLIWDINISKVIQHHITLTFNCNTIHFCEDKKHLKHSTSAYIAAYDNEWTSGQKRHPDVTLQFSQVQLFATNWENRNFNQQQYVSFCIIWTCVYGCIHGTCSC